MKTDDRLTDSPVRQRIDQTLIRLKDRKGTGWRHGVAVKSLRASRWVGLLFISDSSLAAKSVGRGEAAERASTPRPVEELSELTISWTFGLDSRLR